MEALNLSEKFIVYNGKIKNIMVVPHNELLPFSKKCGRSFFCRSLKSTTPTTPTTTEKNKNAQILAQKTKKHLNQYTVTQTNLYNYLLVYC